MRIFMYKRRHYATANERRKDQSTSTMYVIKTEASEDRRETMVFLHFLASSTRSRCRVARWKKSNNVYESLNDNLSSEKVNVVNIAPRCALRR